MDMQILAPASHYTGLDDETAALIPDARRTLTDVCRLLNIVTIADDGELRFPRKRVRAGHWLYGAGEKFDAVYLVQTGFLKSVLVDEFGNEQILGFPMRGDILGIDGLHSARYGSHAVALSDCELIAIPFEGLSDVGHGGEELKNWLFHSISRELVREHAVIGLLGTLGAEARVARFLFGLSKRFKELGYSPTEFNLPMTRQEIGSYLGLTLETVSRALSAMCGCGLIWVSQRAVRLLDLDALASILKLPRTSAGAARASIRASHARKSLTTPAPTDPSPPQVRRNGSIWAGLSAGSAY